MTKKSIHTSNLGANLYRSSCLTAVPTKFLSVQVSHTYALIQIHFTIKNQEEFERRATQKKDYSEEARSYSKFVVCVFRQDSVLIPMHQLNRLTYSTFLKPKVKAPSSQMVH